MRHLPKTEYTAADQRSDTDFLIGARYGRARVAAAVEALATDLTDESLPASVPRSWIVTQLRAALGDS